MEYMTQQAKRKPLTAYLFYYKPTEESPYYYVYIIATTVDQARFFYFRRGFGQSFDWSFYPIDEITEDNFTNHNHHIGEVLCMYSSL